MSKPRFIEQRVLDLENEIADLRSRFEKLIDGTEELAKSYQRTLEGKLVGVRRQIKMRQNGRRRPVRSAKPRKS